MKKIALSLLLASASLFSYACESNAPIVEGYQIDCPFDAKKGTFKEYPQPSKSTVIHQQEINDEIFDVVRLTVDKDGNISEITKNAIVQMTTDNVIEKYVALEVDYFKLKAELTKLYGEPIEGKEVLPFPQVETGMPVFYSYAKFAHEQYQIDLYLLSGDFENGKGDAQFVLAYTKQK